MAQIVDSPKVLSSTNINTPHANVLRVSRKNNLGPRTIGWLPSCLPCSADVNTPAYDKFALENGEDAYTFPIRLDDDQLSDDCYDCFETVDDFKERDASVEKHVNADFERSARLLEESLEALREPLPHDEFPELRSIPALAARGLNSQIVPMYLDGAKQPGEIDPVELILGVQLASLAYTDDHQPSRIDALDGGREAIEMIAGSHEAARLPLTEIMRRQGYTVDKIFSETRILRDATAIDVQGYVAHNDNDVILAFRGSTGLIDWLTNFRAGLVPFYQEKHRATGFASLFSLGANMQEKSAPKCHRGFYDAMIASTKIVDRVLLPQLYSKQPKRCIICGHSLGGAIAMGYLAYLITEFNFAQSPHRVVFVSCGQPRFGDLRFKSWLESNLRPLQEVGKCSAARLVNDHDGVPRVPPGRSGYKHACKAYLLGDDGTLLIAPEPAEKERIGWYAKVKIARYVEDHRPGKYLDRLAKSIKGAANAAMGVVDGVADATIEVVDGVADKIGDSVAAAGAAAAGAVAVELSLFERLRQKFRQHLRVTESDVAEPRTV